MPEDEKAIDHKQKAIVGRREFFNTVLGGVIAAIAGWISGAIPRGVKTPEEVNTNQNQIESRLAVLEAEIARLTEELRNAGVSQPLAELEGEFGERVVFHKKELTIRDPEYVFLNLVSTNGGVGIRFYKDFDFGNEVHTNPWSMGYVQGNPGFQGLAILRDWRFTAALWDGDGRLSLGNLEPDPYVIPPAKARVYVRGTLDEVQTLIEASNDQTADVFQVLGRFKTNCLAVDGRGNVVTGSPEEPNALILHDTQDGSAYSLKVTNGQLNLTRV